MGGRIGLRAAAALALAAVAGGGGDARAEGCAAAHAWRVVMGALRPRPACGAFLAATDGSMLGYSYGSFASAAPVAVPFSFSLSARRLGPEGMPIELFVIGAAVLVKEEAFGLYVPTDDVRFEWQPMPGLHIHDEHRLAVRQTADRVALAIDGREVASWAFHAPEPRGTVSFGFKGASGYRSWASFADVRLDPQ
jgi:hypothetical protein